MINTGTASQVMSAVDSNLIRMRTVRMLHKQALLSSLVTVVDLLLWYHLRKARCKNEQYPQLSFPFQLQPPDSRDRDDQQIDVANHIEYTSCKTYIRGFAAFRGLIRFRVRLSVSRRADYGEDHNHRAVENGCK